jgi:4-amino-4-deoxy-L-arabinose transferase-like glycosyltransferase
MIAFGQSWTARHLAHGRAAAVLLAIAVILGAGFRAVIQTWSPVHSSDTFQHLRVADSLLQGRGFTSLGAEHPDTSRMVVFPCLIALIAAITGNVEIAAHVVVVLGGALIVVPMFLLARSMFGPPAALATLPLGALGCVAGASSRLLVTSVYVTLIIGTIAMGWYAARRRTLPPWLVAGLCVGAVSLLRPEGIAFPLVLSAWAVLPPGRPHRAARLGIVLAGSLLLYLPYVTWASARLGRFAPWPGIEYIHAERRVSDHLGLRDLGSPVEWTMLARYMLTADHGARYLETYFQTGSFPEPDPDLFNAADGSASAVSSSPKSINWENLIRRRLFIVRGNLRRAPWHAVWGHFLPRAVVLLGVAGVVAATRSPRRRAAFVLLALMGIGSLAPLASHVEDRFFYAPFAIGIILAAAGWGDLAALAARWRWPRIVQLGVHALIAAAIVTSGVRHEGYRLPAIARAGLLHDEAVDLRDKLPPGPVMAVSQHFPYWAGRLYRPIPVASLEGVFDYARSQGARTLVLEADRDMEARPELAWLLAPNRPAFLHVVRDVTRPHAGRLLVFEIEPEAR